MNSEFMKKNKFRKKKLNKLIYIKNVDKFFNYKELIEYTVEIELFFKEYKKRIEIDIISKQKQNIILRILQLVYHNLEIDWKTREVKMIRCPDECRKQ